MSEKVIIEVGVTGTGEGEQKVKSLKAQLREMKNELLGLDEGSDRFKKLSKEAGALTDKIGDVSDKVKALSSDTKKLDALVGVGSAIAGGFQAAQGAMALFGSNSKEVEKAIQNIIAVQGILNGVQQVGQFLTAKGIVQDQIANAGLLIKSGVLKAVTAAQWLWNAAMTANPIGLIVAGIAALVAGIVLLIKYMDKAIAVFMFWSGMWAAQAEAEAQEEQKKQKRRQAEADAHKQRLKEINEQRDARIKSADATISALELEKDTLEANGESSEAVTVKILEAELEKTKAVLDANNQKLQSWITYYENLAMLSGKSREDFIAEQKARGIDLEALQEKANALIKANEDSVVRSENAITKFKREQGEQRSADAQAEADRLKEIEEKRLADLEKARIDQLELDAENRERYLEADKLFKERQLELEQEQLDAEFDLLEANIDRENAIKDLALQQDLERKAKNQKTAEDFAQASMNLVNTVFTLTNRLGKQDEASKEERAKRQFKIGKALQLGLAVMDGFKAITSSLAQAPIAIGPIPNPAGIASLAFAATTAALNIAKIASTQYNGGASNVGVTTPNIGTASDSVGSTTPNVTPIQAGSTFLNKEPIEVFVLEKKMTDTQNKVGAIVKEATF